MSNLLQRYALYLNFIVPTVFYTVYAFSPSYTILGIYDHSPFFDSASYFLGFAYLLAAILFLKDYLETKDKKYSRRAKVIFLVSLLLLSAEVLGNAA